jgi:hypothetical protein
VYAISSDVVAAVMYETPGERKFRDLVGAVDLADNMKVANDLSQGRVEQHHSSKPLWALRTFGPPAVGAAIATLSAVALGDRCPLSPKYYYPLLVTASAAYGAYSYTRRGFRTLPSK